VRIQQVAWFFDQGCDWWDQEPAAAEAYLTRLLGRPEPASPYSEGILRKLL
jgi:hypothetical protein